MAKDMNKKAFDDATKLKLDIFGECFEEWLPVFNNDFFTDSVYVFDFFAGSGNDTNGINGSPLILLSNAKSYCKKLKKPVKFIFNELENDKVQLLKDNIDKVTHKCVSENDCRECVLQRDVVQYEFKELFNQKQVQDILEDNKIGKFILLDQYGFKHVNDDIFRQLVNYPKTDFIFFISSSNIRRFKKHNSVKKYIETDKVNFNETKPKECHRAMAGYFKTLVDKEYYIHHFTIKKGANYWGLIFGSNHTFGMEKFLKVCWKHDEFSGEANYNIDDNWDKDSLFYALGSNVKKDLIKKKIEERILSGKIKNNLNGFKYAMLQGCEPKLFTKVVQKLEKDKKITRQGNLNYNSTRIHKVKEYKIERLNDGA